MSTRWGPIFRPFGMSVQVYGSHLLIAGSQKRLRRHCGGGLFLGPRLLRTRPKWSRAVISDGRMLSEMSGLCVPQVVPLQGLSSDSDEPDESYCGVPYT